MTTYATPGVYLQPLQPARAQGSLVRSDVTAFFGYARQGPVQVPIRVESWRQYRAIFGEPYSIGHLAAAVKGYFENGARTCYVVRVTDGRERAATVSLPTGRGGQWEWRFRASFRLARVADEGSDPRREPDPAVRIAARCAGEQAARRLPNPGAWGNRLAISLSRGSLLGTQTTPGRHERGFVTPVESLSGLEPHTIVELVQPLSGDDETLEPLSAVVAVEEVDAARQRITWKSSLEGLGFDLQRPIRVESVEFSLDVALDGRVVESFRDLSPHPEHSRGFTRLVSAESDLLDVELVRPPATTEAEITWSSPDLWPPEVSAVGLRGGADGLADVAASDYLAGLDEIARVDDVALLAAPDLVLSAEPLAFERRSPLAPKVDCTLLEAPRSGSVFGRLVTSVDDGEEVREQPVARATVTETRSRRQARTNAKGEFRLEEIDIGIVTLRFEQPGFAVEEQLTPASVTPSSEPTTFFMQPLLLPRSLPETEVLTVQSAMAAQGEEGLYRMALLDPPQPGLEPDEIRNWRAKLGDTAYGALFHPWLAAVPPGAEIPVGARSRPLQWLPPSGHVAGAMARTDRTEGVHRAAANAPLRDARDVSVEIDEAQHGVLNPVGVNCIRSFAGRGIRIFGARTLSSDAEWRYINARRLVMALEKTLEKSLPWATFEANNVVLRQSVTLQIRAILDRLWRRGALAGGTSDAAYRVKCDRDNNPPAIRDAGRLIAEVAVAPTVPFEFITIRLARTLEAIEVTE